MKLNKIIIVILIFMFISCKYIQNTEYKYNYVLKENIFKIKEINYTSAKITAYTPNCNGCSGITSSGYNVKNKEYYNDLKYNKIRIVAADKQIPFGTIIYIKEFNEYFIVLDRGSAIGKNKEIQYDLLFLNYEQAINFGIKEINYKIIREGF